MPDFPSTIGGGGKPGLLQALDSYLVLNYYVFYPLMSPSPVAQSDFDV